MTWREGLRDEQAWVAGAPRQHVVLLAGPGTGKTYVLVRRVQNLVDAYGVSPKAITALTFTRAAAAEMRERLVERMGSDGRRVRVSTLHAYSLRELLARGARDLPLPVRVAGDWEERHIVVEELARMLGRTVNEISNGGGDGSLDLLADDWDTLAVDGSGWEEGHPDPDFLGAWRRHRHVYGYTLRSELVYQLLCELRSNPEFQPTRQTDVVVVDEYQDLNQCDLSTIRHLAERTGAEVFAAGDDDQSIYSFRGAHPAGIRGFTDAYEGAAQLELSECCRCGSAVVQLGDWLINQEQDRVPKALRSVTPWDASVHLLRFTNQVGEAAGVARAAKAEIDRGVPPEEILVLVKSDRNNRVTQDIAKALKRLNLDAYLPRRGGMLPDEVQRFLQYLILSKELTEAERIDDLALRGLMELEKNGVGEARLWRVTQLALERGFRFGTALDYIHANPDEFGGTRLAELVAERERIVEVARSLTQKDGEAFHDWLTRIAEQLNLEQDALDLIVQAATQVEAEIEDEQSEEASEQDPAQGDTAQAGESSASRDFVMDLAAAMMQLGDTLPAREEGKVTVTTMHGAKGLSADVVIVLQAEDEVIPGEATGLHLDESRRLLYVSLTRARKRLVISACMRRTGVQRYVGQLEIVKRTLTRFIRDYGLEALTVEEFLEQLKKEGQVAAGTADDS